jgi:HEAT repeat protein
MLSMLFCYPMLLSAGLAELDTASPVDVQVVRRLLGRFDFRDELLQLLKLGESAFPAYEALLADPTEHPVRIVNIFVVLRDIKGDRSRFLEHAVRRLVDGDEGVRWHAVKLVAEIGSIAEASPLIALLSDKDITVRYAAAQTLVAIGGSREVIAMDAWLLGDSHRADFKYRQRVKECRDQLQKRLDDERTKRKS